MATTTTRLALRKPEDTSPDDPVDVIADISDNMDKLDAAMSGQSVVAFPGTPFKGKIVIRSDQNDTPYIYDGNQWRRVIIERTDTTLPKQVTNGTSITSTSTAYVAGSTELSTTFFAPLSGAIYVFVNSLLEGTTPSSAWVSWELRLTNAAGAIVQAAIDDNGVSVQDGFNSSPGNESYIPGLTPITQLYFIRAMLRTTNAANAANVFSRRLLVKPSW